MSDQGRWFKLWCLALTDQELENLSLEDWARWARLGTYIKEHGHDGKIVFAAPARALTNLFRVSEFRSAIDIIKRFPHCKVGERETTVTTVTNATVTVDIEYLNWLKFQGDFSNDRVRKFRDKKRHAVTAQEERRSRREEKRKEEKVSPTIPPLKFLDYVFLQPEEHQKLQVTLGAKLQSYLERLNGYIGQIGPQKAAKKYASHYHTILNWHRKDLLEGKITHGTNVGTGIFDNYIEKSGTVGHRDYSPGLRKTGAPLGKILDGIRDRKLSGSDRKEESGQSGSPPEPERDRDNANG